MFKRLVFTYFVFINSVFLGFSQLPIEKLQQGDIIFQELNCGSLCESIAKVTPSKDGYLFTHAGLIVKKDGEIMVIEAIGTQVQCTRIEDFIKRTAFSKKKGIAVARFKSSAKAKKASLAAELALNYLGVPYDNAFLPDGSALYCTELIQLVFRKVGLGNAIKSKPMTFKDPETGKILEAWQKYYDELNLKVPEGLMGTNPGRLSLYRGFKFIY